MKSQWVMALAILAVGFAAACDTGDTIVRPHSSDSDRITVSGSALIEVEPDLAEVRMAVRSEAPVVTDAVADNNVRTEAVLTALRATGVQEDDIRTESFRLFPRHSREGVVTGHEAYNTLIVLIRDLPAVGTVLQQAITAGADNISGVTFRLADPTPIRAQAEALAIENARQRAEGMATAAGIEVGSVVSVNDLSAPINPVLYRSLDESAGADAAVPIEPGSLQISATVQVVYSIK